MVLPVKRPGRDRRFSSHRVHDFLERSRAFGRPDCDNWHCRYAREQIGYLARKERGWMRRADVQSFTVNYVSRHSHTKADHLRKGAWLPRSFTLSTINLIAFSFSQHRLK